MLPATFCAGMTLPIITRTLIRAGAGERAIGRVYAWNTLGSIVGVVVGGVVLLPLIGVKAMLVAGATLDMAIGILLVLRSSDRRVGAGWLAGISPRPLAAGLAVATVAVCALVLGRVQLQERLLASGVYRHGVITDPNAWDMKYYRDGRTATVSSFKVRATQGFTLATNGKPDASLGPEWFRRCDAGAPRTTLTGDAATQVLVPLIALAYAPQATAGGRDRLRLRHDVTHAARRPEHQGSRHHRDRAADGAGRPRLLPRQPAGVRRPSRPPRHRRCEVVLRLRPSQVRPDPVGAVQPVGERRLGPVHDGVLRPRTASI